MYDWECVRVSGLKLEGALESATSAGWEVFTIVQAGDDPSQPPNNRYFYTIVVRRPKQAS
jgi:hypothetical protein